MSSLYPNSKAKNLKATDALHNDVVNSPFYVSNKFNGVKATLIDGVLYSKSGKKIPNLHIQKIISSYNLPNGVEGEILCGYTFEECVSAAMKVDSKPLLFCYVIFDIMKITQTETFENRMARLLDEFKNVNIEAALNPHNQEYITNWIKRDNIDSVILPNTKSFIINESNWNSNASQQDGTWSRFNTRIKNVYIAKHYLTTNKCQVQDIFGYSFKNETEGIILRNKYTDDIYKMKHKNSNEATIVDAKQLVRKDGTIEDMVGSLLVKRGEKLFRIGTGMNYEIRTNLWNMHLRSQLVGKLASYEFDSENKNGIPRFPRFICIRDDIDMI